MKRLSAIVLLGLGAMMSSSAAGAAGVSSMLHRVQRPDSLSKAWRTRIGRVLPLSRDVRRAERSAAAGARQDAAPAALRLPDTAFSPGTLNQQYVGVEDNAAADGDPFRVLHSASYTTWSRITGYYERADWTPPGNDLVLFRYQGSFFPSTSSAQSAWQDGATTAGTQEAANSGTCSNDNNVLACQDVVFGPSSTTYYYTAMQYRNCLAELETVTTDNTYQVQKSTILSTMDTLKHAAAGVMASACGSSPSPAPQPSPSPSPTSQPPSPAPQPTPAPVQQPSITIDQVLIAHTVKKKLVATQTVKSGEGVLFEAIYHVSNAGAATATGTLTLLHNGTKIGQTQLTPQTLSNGSPILEVGLKFKFKKTAQLTAQFTVQLGAASDTQSLDFVVKAQKKKKK